MKKACIVSLMCALLPAMAAAQEREPRAERQAEETETTLTGCLTKGTAAGEYMLADEVTGLKTPVTGAAAELDKHASNHKVKLTGVRTMNKESKMQFRTTRIEHIADSCQAPQPK